MGSSNLTPSSAPIAKWQVARYLTTSPLPGTRPSVAGTASSRTSKEWVSALNQALTQSRASTATPSLAPASGLSPAAANALATALTIIASPAVSKPSVPGLDPVTTPAAVAPRGGQTAVNFPRPAGDNGRGIHWIPTVSSSKETVDRFVDEAVSMKVKWAVVLNDGTNTTDNDYLVNQLVQKGIMPVMRVYTPGLVPISGDLSAMVKHYKAMGVSYFQLYNEPNLAGENPDGVPNVQRYLDLWLPAAKTVIAAGGLPGFGALSPQGQQNDLEFLQQSLSGLVSRGSASVLDSTWLSMHNYAAGQPVSDRTGFSRFKEYASVMQRTVGRVLPIVGTEGGVYATGDVSESRQVQLVTDAYKYMSQREPYLLAYSYWVIANEAGGGRDGEYSYQALFRGDGSVSPVVNALRGLS